MKQDKQDSRDPFTDARKKYREIYAGYLSGMKSWRAVAAASLFANIVLALGIAYVSAQPRSVPYVIRQDGTGALHPVGAVASADYSAPDLVRHEVGQFVEQLRSVTPDRAVQGKWLESVFAKLPQNGAAHKKVLDWLQKNNPAHRAERETVSVQVVSALPVSSESWQVEWRETRYTRSGSEIESQSMRAIIQLRQQPPKNEEGYRLNPLGILITNIDLDVLSKDRTNG